MRYWVLAMPVLGLGNAGAVEYAEGHVGEVTLIVAQVDLQKEKLQLFLRDEHGQTYKSLDKLVSSVAAHGKSVQFAMNGGMFHPDFAPVGLYVADGVQLTPLNTQSGAGNFFLLPNGVFGINAKGAFVVETAGYGKMAAGMTLATQSGPLLLRDGAIHPAFKPDSSSRLVRNGVCAPAPDRVALVISNGPLNLYQFAQFFRDQLGCKDALYLDGNISSLYAPALHRNDLRGELGPIIVVTSE